MRRLAPFILVLAMLGSACASSREALAVAQTGLELEHVVLYRNGVGYFERMGEVDGDRLRLKVRRDQVNDLLKSLTVVDRRDGQAVSVSMPLDPQTWANAALSNLGPGHGSLATVLDQLRGTEVMLETVHGRMRGRIVMVEAIETETERDHKLTLLDDRELRTAKLSQIRDITLQDGDLAMQLHRRLDGSAGEGMFQQIDVEVRLVGATSHDLVVSYVVAAPMWKPTYRVVLPEHGQGPALLQAWAVVDNTSGEDWDQVSMSLTAGEPIVFAYDLHTPRQVERDDLTEAGVRKRAHAAMGETTYAPSPGEPSNSMEADRMEADRMVAEESADEAWGGGMARGAVGGPSAVAPPPPPVAPALTFEALQRSTGAHARAHSVSGQSRYDLGERVTVPNGSSTLVAIVNETIAAEETFLYRPGGAGTGYEANPYRVVRFRNTTPFVLEPGPISIYSSGSFVGEGMSEAVSTQASATIPFAVEPSLIVSSQVQHDGEEMRLLRLVRGVLEVETFARVRTIWSVVGPKQERPIVVLARHGKSGSNYTLVDPPESIETLPDAYLVPVRVAAGGTSGQVELVEQTPSHTTLSIWDGRATTMLEQVLVASGTTAATRQQLQPIVDLRQSIGRIDTQIDGLQRQQVELDARAAQMRANLEAIKKDPAANDLRETLSQRLEDFSKQGDELARKIVELQSTRLEQRIALEDQLQGLDLRP